MQDIPSPPATAATDEPAVPSTGTALEPVPIDEAIECGADSRPGHTTRQDGWTPEAIRAFITKLAECGCVRDAAKAAGRSVQAAYNLRNATKGRAFRVAWDAALLHARDRLADALMSRALDGQVRTLRRNGEVWGEEHRFDNRLATAMLTRLDRLAESDHHLHSSARFVAEELDQFLDLVCDQGKGAVGFVRSRLRLGYEGHAETRTLLRADNYRDYGVGMPGEIDVSDLDPANMAGWTREQAERAERSGFLDELEGRGSSGNATADFIRRLIG